MEQKSPLREIIEISGATEKKKIINHEMKIEEKKYDNSWDSCCIKSDRRAVQFFSQLGVMAGIMSFCIYQLATLLDCDKQNAYLALLTLLIGILIPNPKMNS